MLLPRARKIIKKKHFILLLGAAILSFGLFNIHSQSSITEGGILGMTLLINHKFGISPGITGLWMDAIVYCFAYKILGKEFLKDAIFTTIGFSMFYNIYEYFGYVLPSLESYPLVAAVLGGLIVGLGVGIILKYGGASGGDDTLALMITKLSKCSISKSYFIIDFVVLMLSLTYIPFSKIIFSLLSVTVSSFVVGRLHSSGTELKSSEALS